MASSHPPPRSSAPPGGTFCPALPPQELPLVAKPEKPQSLPLPPGMEPSPSAHWPAGLSPAVAAVDVSSSGFYTRWSTSRRSAERKTTD